MAATDLYFKVTEAAQLGGGGAGLLRRSIPEDIDPLLLFHRAQRWTITAP